MDIDKIVQSTIMGVVGLMGIFLIIIALLVRDYQFMTSNPLAFLTELLFFSVIPAIMFTLVFVKTRKMHAVDSVPWFLAMVIKFALFHILFQLAGIYTAIFDRE